MALVGFKGLRGDLFRGSLAGQPRPFGVVIISLSHLLGFVIALLKPS